MIVVILVTYIILEMFILTNLFLAIFNILPLHPLDGGKVLARFLPASINYKLEQNEHMTSWILMFLMLSGALSILRQPVYFLFQIAFTKSIYFNSQKVPLPKK